MKAINYVPKTIDNSLTLQTSTPSAWGDIPTILKSIINDFDIKTDKALEFGVEYGYSTSALANYFNSVIGVDTFKGDVNSGGKEYFYDYTKELLKSYKNIELTSSDYQSYFKLMDVNERFDLIHIDIIHTYEDTFACGDMALEHCNAVIFHDTISFSDVYDACSDLADKHNCLFYNYEESHGLGILIKK
jgi:predicted O-methyltransferase YrrM